MLVPENLLYSAEHGWVKEEDGKVTIGLTDFAQDEFGDIVFVELPEVGDELEIDEPYGSVESVKTVSELYAPLSGKVIEVNEPIGDSPELINESPYENAWLVVIEPSKPEEKEQLLSREAYAKMINQA